MYSSVLASVLREKGSNLKLVDMQEAVKEHWRIRNNLLNEGEDSEDEDSDDKIKETALNALQNTVCYNCGKKGHKANKCPEKKKSGNGKGKFTGTCNNCGKRGHKIADCWLLEKNKHKRPANWKNPNETGNVASDEYFLMCHQISDEENVEVPDIATAKSYDENEDNPF